MCCPAALEWGLCKASTWVTVLSKSTVCPVPSLLFSPFPSNRIDRCEAFALLIMWKKMIDQSTVSKSDLGLGLNSLHMVAASLPAGGRPVLAWNRRLPQWNRNSLRGTACYLRLSCCFLLLRVYRINYSYIIICNYSIYIYTWFWLWFCHRIRAFLVVRWLHLWLQRSSTIWKSTPLTISDIKRKRTGKLSLHGLVPQSGIDVFCRYDDALRLALGAGLGSAYPYVGNEKHLNCPGRWSWVTGVVVHGPMAQDSSSICHNVPSTWLGPWGLQDFASEVKLVQ